jgi:hypothetical protein
MRIELLHAPGCPHTATIRARLRTAMRQLNIDKKQLTERIDATYPRRRCWSTGPTSSARPRPGRPAAVSFPAPPTWSLPSRPTDSNEPPIDERDGASGSGVVLHWVS